ncbi:MAG: hypothetical protein IJE43_19070 [Alphaproteobacteria bacterium]|nr:hypothetical protein [Alphaproteobacteria bacterium]
MFGTANVILTLGIFLLAIPIAVIQMRQTKMKEDGTYIAHKKAQAAKRYVFLSNNFLTRKAFRQVVLLNSALSCFDFETLQQKSVDTYVKALTWALGIPLFVTITQRHIVLTCIGVLAGYLYYQMTIGNAYDREIKLMYMESSLSIQSVSDCYSLTDDIVKAVKIAERAPCLERIISELYESLTAERREKAIYNFKRKVPLRIISSLATTCNIAVEEGDSKNEGELSALTQKLTQLRLEADSKIRHLQATEDAFSSLSKLSLTGMIVAPIFDWFLLSNMPGTSVYLQGFYGAIEKTLLMVITCFSYYIITILQKPSVVATVDKSEFVDKISKQRLVKKFVNNLIPKTMKEQVKWEKRFADAISAKDIVYTYTLKVLLFISALVIMTVSLFAFTITARIRLWNNYGSLSAIDYSVEVTETMYRQLVELDEVYLTAPEKMSDDEARQLVRGRVSGLLDMDVEQQVDRLSTKWDNYYSIGFKWWYILIIYAAGLLAWRIPEGLLLIRSYLVRFEADEDIMQLQSLMMTLQSTKYDVRKCLYWMAEESTVHKNMLQYAYIEFASDRELALLRLKDSVSSRDMKRMISKLEKAIYDLSISEAFRDIALDKQQALALHEALQTKQLQIKQQFARSFANMPLNIAIYGNLIIPIMALGLTQLLSTLSELGVG